MSNLRVAVEFSSGAELLFDGCKKKELLLPIADENDVWTLKRLIQWLKDTMLTEKPELFVDGDRLRPGILVLVNDVDWELMGELEYQLQSDDKILFISTLHGG
ncbi:ubiquitin-related modifier 1-like protein [Dinothrombium tinctorium]|uniref:Ubiquitin-related modifier 1 homolog n=1 Tax=Dinothrombium tinctorium TaxID=1965070 RepID=A0A3S3SF15_9ACAR|nr:ubiquitin-related modifier 1-like protein [Dinothrombium tinctorium]RWS10546.1 ubiquitin-related modifier 1-like protein [Dinothrombium tinctorium]RWS13233.1 ubiquitin-related modifier 1-like protein [Dinothrombium tinctorium]RWS16696.1 ubiquitin-related modifier 1-like protein [Dinothrombium tinctorium]